MLARRDQPFPLQAVRDLIGLVRAMAAACEPDERVRRQRLARVEHELEEAMGLAAETGPDTVGHRAAWTRAERAIAELGELDDVLLRLKPVLDAARERVLRRG
jgi:hypothetical protein